MYRLELPKVLELNKLSGSCLKLDGSRLMLTMLLKVVLEMLVVGESSKVAEESSLEDLHQ